MAKAPQTKVEVKAEVEVAKETVVNPLNVDANLSKLPTSAPVKDPVLLSSADNVSLQEANNRAYELMRINRDKKTKLDKAIKDAVKSIVDKA